MSANLAEHQKLLEKIQFLSEDKLKCVLSFVDSLSSLKDESQIRRQDKITKGEVAREVNLDVVTKIWQPCNDYDAIEKLTNLLEIDKLNSNEKL
ncbi:MAG: hypothetical protein VKL41_22485 [Snowella sp.]|nr:hypothetical protein [Snowella sp.]